MKAYGRSKLANMLFTRELARRLHGQGVTVNCLHPGAVSTNIWSHAMWWTRPFLAVAKLFMVTPEKGGERIVYLATVRGRREDRRLLRGQQARRSFASRAGRRSGG